MLGRIIYVVFGSFNLLIIIRVVLSWLRMERGNPFSDFVYDFTEPILSKLRVVIPLGGGGLDFSPIIALIIIQILMQITLLVFGGMPI